MTADASEARLRVRVALIHDGRQERLRHSRLTASTVSAVFRRIADVEFVEIFRQPGFRQTPLRVLIARHARQWQVERRWARHLGVSRRWFLSTGLFALRMIQLLSRRTRRQRSLQHNIERALAAKHESAWRSAYEDGVDVLVVLEDDAMTRVDSAEALERLIAQLPEKDLPNVYLDLAGGLTARQLRISHVSSPVGGSLVALSSPASNTSCAYVVGRAVVAGLSEMTIRTPEVANLPSDWMINRYFIESTDGVRCFHTQPPVLQHGSKTGAVPSSMDTQLGLR